MREIKFRAWDKYNKRWLSLWTVVFATDGSIMAVRDLDDEVYGLHQADLAQYTGLLDKNGKEIYEGDLIKDIDSDFIGEVIWDEYTLCFTTKFQDNDLWGFSPVNGRDNHCEIVGNIYEGLTITEK